MGMSYSHITREQEALIRASRVFFVASVAPDLSVSSDGFGPVNLSPKGGALHVVDPNRVAYLDHKGSGDETARHAIADGPMTVMVMSMNGNDAAVVRLFGRATVCSIEQSPLSGLFVADEVNRLELPARQVIEVAVERTQTSCGYGVPVFEFVSHRSRSQRGRRYKRAV